MLEFNHGKELNPKAQEHWQRSSGRLLVVVGVDA